MAEKKQLRTTLRELRDRVDAGTTLAAAAAATDRLLELLPQHPGATIAIYAAMGSELATAELSARLIGRGAALAFPRVAPPERVLEFYAADPGRLIRGYRDIPEPDPMRTPRVVVDDIDAFVIPGLAFARSGARLGWGRGYYDATLAANPRALRIGLAFELQVVEEVPTDSLDEPMDWLVTPSYVHQCPVRPKGPSGRSEP